MGHCSGYYIRWMMKNLNDTSLMRWCPVAWPPRFGCGLAPGALVRIRHLEFEGDTQTAFVQSRRSVLFNAHKVILSELHAPTSTTPQSVPGCQICKASCPLRGSRLTAFRARIIPVSVKPIILTAAISKYMARIGRKGGSRITPARLEGLRKARAARAQHIARRAKNRLSLAK